MSPTEGRDAANQTRVVQVFNASNVRKPLEIDEPVSLVAVINARATLISVLHFVLHVRAIHATLSELHESSSLRFALDDESRDDESVSQWLIDVEAACRRLSIEMPEFSVRATELRPLMQSTLDAYFGFDGPASDPTKYALTEDELRAALDGPAPRFALPNQVGQDRVRLLVQREGRRTFTTETALPLLGSIAWGDGRPVIVVAQSMVESGLRLASLVARLLELPAQMAFSAVISVRIEAESSPSAPLDTSWRYAQTIGERIVRTEPPALVRHALLCCGRTTVWRRAWSASIADAQRTIENATIDQFETCRRRVRRVSLARQRAQERLAKSEAMVPASDETRAELERYQREFEAALRRELRVEAAAQALEKVARKLDNVRLEGTVGDVREALSMLDAMSRLVGLDEGVL